MLKPGDLLVPLFNEEFFVWRSNIEVNDDQLLCEIPGDSIMVFLESKKMPKEDWVAKRWESAYRVLTPTGKCGWVGSGWVKKLHRSGRPQGCKRCKKLLP